MLDLVRIETHRDRLGRARSKSSSPTLSPVSAVLSAADAEDLRWYFRTGGMGIFCPSPTAALIAQLEMYGRTARPCERCGGDPVKWRAGTGFIDSSTGKAPEQPTVSQSDMLRILDIELPFVLGDQLCPDCGGRGWRIPKSKKHARAALTARPNGGAGKGKRKANTGVEVDVTDLARLGRVSGRLSAVRAAEGNIPAAAALEAYYSPDGGSLGALWHLTPAGKTMLRTNPHRLPPSQFFANERAAQSEKPSAKRKALFDTAEEQAAVLFEAACRLWNATHPRKDGKR